MFVTLRTFLGLSPYMSARTPYYMFVVVVVGGPVAKACDVSSIMFSYVHSQSATSGEVQFLIAYKSTFAHIRG